MHEDSTYKKSIYIPSLKGKSKTLLSILVGTLMYQSALADIQQKEEDLPTFYMDKITVYAIGTGFDRTMLDYALPDRKSSRNAYLANLSRYVSLLLNAPVQFDSKAVVGIAEVSFET